jgi:cysteine dioxygenase
LLDGDRLRPAQTCELEPTTQLSIDSESPVEVDPSEPIHLVANPSSFGSRAVTLHVYSLPFDTCEVYDLTAGRYQDVKLVNTTEHGVLTSDRQVEKVML